MTAKEIYFSDFEEFVKESQLEDTFENDKKAIFVSTIHKAKGREFDTVYLLLNDVQGKTDEEKRRVFVGMSRAKNTLRIHYSGSLFRNLLHAKGIVRVRDKRSLSAFSEIAMSLSLSDVYLNFVSGKKDSLCQLRCGQTLYFKDNTFFAKLQGRWIECAYLSQACKTKLVKYLQAGYVPSAAEIGFIVAWVNQEQTQTEAVVLPNLYLKKNDYTYH